MINKLVVIIESLKVPKIKKVLLYEMKFLVPNYSCLHNPWLGGYRPQISFLFVFCPQVNLLTPIPEQNSWLRHCSKASIVTLVQNSQGFLSSGQSCRQFKITAHQKLVSRIWMNGSLPQSPHTTSRTSQRQIYLYTFLLRILTHSVFCEGAECGQANKWQEEVNMDYSLCLFTHKVQEVESLRGSRIYLSSYSTGAVNDWNPIKFDIL